MPHIIYYIYNIIYVTIIPKKEEVNNWKGGKREFGGGIARSRNDINI